jgi:hypothetical protein
MNTWVVAIFLPMRNVLFIDGVDLGLGVGGKSSAGSFLSGGFSAEQFIFQSSSNKVTFNLIFLCIILVKLLQAYLKYT